MQIMALELTFEIEPTQNLTKQITSKIGVIFSIRKKLMVAWLFTHRWHVRCTTKRVGGSAIPSPTQGFWEIARVNYCRATGFCRMSWLYSKWLGWANANKKSSSNPKRSQMLMHCFFLDVSNDWYIIQNSNFCSNGKKSPWNSKQICRIVNLNLPTYIHSLRKPHTNHRETRPLAIKPISADCVVVSLKQVTTRSSALVKNLGESFGPSSKINI